MGWRNWFAARLSLHVVLLGGLGAGWALGSPTQMSSIQAGCKGSSEQGEPNLTIPVSTARVLYVPGACHEVYKATWWTLLGWGRLGTMRAQLCPRRKLATLALSEAVVDCSPIPAVPGWCLAAFQPRCYPQDCACGAGAHPAPGAALCATVG